MAQVIVNELKAVKKEFARPRRTVIENGVEAVYEEKKAEEMDVYFLMDRFGYARTIDALTYERNKEAADGEHLYVLPCKNTGKICLFTEQGQLYTLKVADLPFGKFRDKGTPVDNVSNYDSAKERLILAVPQSTLNVSRILFVTGQAMAKVVDGGEFDVSKRTVLATKLGEGDSLLYMAAVNDQQSVVLQSKEGYFLRFLMDEIPEKKKGAIGVRAMKLGEKDSLEAVYDTRPGGDEVITYKEKQLRLQGLKVNKRDTKGTKIRVL